MMDAVSGFASLVWPPTGIALAALLLFGYRLWPAVALAAFLVNWQQGAPLTAAAGIAMGNTLEAVLGVFFLRCVGFEPALNRVKDVLMLAFLGAGLSTLFSATVGVASLELSGVVPVSGVRSTWFAWWIGDMLGNLIIAPLLLTWHEWFRDRKNPARSAEASLLLLATAVLTFGLFGHIFGTNAKNYPLSYIIFPPLIWAALRFGPVGAVTTVFLSSAVAIWGTMRGIGPFAMGSVRESLMFLQIFLGVAAVTTMILASAVAERRCSEAALHEVQRFQSTLISNLPGFVYRCLNDKDWTMVYLSEGVRPLTGHSPGALLQNRSFSFGKDIIVPEDQDRIWNEVQAALSEKKPYQLVYRIRTKDGMLKWVWERGRGIFEGGSGRLAALEGFITDITPQKEAEEELKRSNKELEQFAYITSHDLRDPLQKIIGFGDLLKVHCAEGLGERGRDYIERMQHATMRMNRLIEDILTFSRAATAVEELDSVDLQGVVQEALSNLELQIVESKAKISVGKLPSVHADRVQMVQLFQNLFSNALKFRKKEDPPRVSIEGRLTDATAEISVSDNGVGFDEKFADRIFKPFERLHARGEYGGSGIGLAICHKIVERHHGRITASSTPGRGAVFTVALPVGGKV
jgi:PAS domain S-box-containing protein